jgi:hypothetical protein
MTRNDETHLFVVRVWESKTDANEEPQWCGKAQDVLSTRGGYFDNWQELVALLQNLVAGPNVGRHEAEENSIQEES